MTDFQLTPAGLYVPPNADDGAYLTRKVGARFKDFARLVDGANTTVTDNGDGTLQIDASGGAGTLTVQDEGTTVATGVSQIDFQGAGVTASAGTGEVVVTIPGGGGSGATINDRQWSAAPSSTSIDEFNDASLDANWARVDASGGSSRATWTEGADVLSVKTAGGDAAGELHAMMRPLTSAGGSMATGDAFVTAMRMLGPAGTAYTMSALVVANGATYGAGAQMMALSWATTTAGVQNNDLRDWAGYNNWASATQVSNMVTGFGPLLYVRLVYLGSNVWRRDLSPDGVTWLTGDATFTKTLTPTHVGVATSSYGTSTKGVASFEFLRRMAGVS